MAGGDAIFPTRAPIIEAITQLGGEAVVWRLYFFFRRKIKIIVLTAVTYAALC